MQSQQTSKESTATSTSFAVKWTKRSYHMRKTRYEHKIIAYGTEVNSKRKEANRSNEKEEEEEAEAEAENQQRANKK